MGVCSNTITDEGPTQVKISCPASGRRQALGTVAFSPGTVHHNVARSQQWHLVSVYCEINPGFRELSLVDEWDHCELWYITEARALFGTG